MFWKKRAKEKPIDSEPVFVTVKNDDIDMAQAHELAASSMALFKDHVLRSGEHSCCAKLRFHDPDLSEELGEDRFAFMWLSEVVFHTEDSLYSGCFFSVPPEFEKWHQVGERLAFEGDDVFDWMVNEQGRLLGGYTLRVVRNQLPEDERSSYDNYTGVTSWVPLSEHE